MSTIQLIQGSAVEQHVDAVVNAANRYLAAGGGICGAEGGCYFLAEGTDEQISALREIIAEVETEDPFTL